MPQTPEQRNANLRSFKEMTPEQLKEVSSKGGKKSAQMRAYNRTFKEATQWALSLPAIKGNPTVDKIRKQYPGLTNQDALVIAVTAEGIAKGDVKALQVLRDTVGETPSQQVSLSNVEPMKIKIEVID